jgi:hypothetical protein
VFRFPRHCALLFVCAALTVCMGPKALAQTARKYSNEFLKIGVGAHAGAMGYAYSALVNDATAGYWNPAALTQISEPYALGLMHAEQFAGVVKYDYAGFATRIDEQSHFALSVIRLGVDDIPNTLNFRDGNSFNYARITAFSVADLAVLISYARKLSFMEGLSVGGNFKLINRTVGQFATAWGFGLDVAAHLKRGRWSAGLVVTDATSNEIPVNNIELTLPAARLGIARSFGNPDRFAIQAAFEAELTFDGERNTLLASESVSIDPKIGVEALFRNLIAVRLGAYNAQYVRTQDGGETLDVAPSAGLGLQLPLKGYTLHIDYALTNLSGFSDNLNSHLVSVRFGFDKLSK